MTQRKFWCVPGALLEKLGSVYGCEWRLGASAELGRDTIADGESWRLPLDRELLFNALLATAVDGIIVIDEFGRVLVYSEACERLFGYSAAEVLGKNVKMLMPPPYYAEHDSYLAKYRESGERKIIGIGREVVGRRKNGTTFPMYLSVGERAIEGRRIFIGIVHDVTERRRGAEVAQRLAAIVESSDDAIISMELNGVVTSWNRGAERLYGYTAEEMLGRPVATIVPPGRQDEEPHILDAISRGERVEHLETTRLRKDGNLVDVSLTTSPMRNASGQVVGASKIARNISERKADERHIAQLQAELLHATRLVSTGQLGAALAHELNQPLTAILNYTSVLDELAARINDSDGEMFRDVVKRITEQTGRAGDIIRRLRDFVAKRELDRQIQDLNEVVEESIALGLVGAVRGNVLLKKKLNSEIAAVFIDRIQIQQVLINLLRNAVEAMTESPKRQLLVATHCDGPESVRVSVADTGAGLPAQIEANLFQPFLTTKEHGLGIGLSICRSIVEAHGGRLWMEPNPGGGTIFQFRLPVAGDERSAL